jgi:hypothetical protein
MKVKDLVPIPKIDSLGFNKVRCQALEDYGNIEIEVDKEEIEALARGIVIDWLEEKGEKEFLISECFEQLPEKIASAIASKFPDVIKRR